jgi:hypothetical protein
MIKLTSIFVKSPFKKMREHMLKVMESVTLLSEFFDALRSDNQAKVEKLREKVFDAEHAADDIKNEMRDHLPRSVFMPINRRDLLEILDLQDSIGGNENSFLSIVDAWKKKGLDHSSGLQGRFRTTAHELEALAENFKVDRLYLLLLQLRRREKDYQVDLTLKKRRRFQCV